MKRFVLLALGLVACNSVLDVTDIEVASPESLQGTAALNVIYAGAGNDDIQAKRGNDLVCGNDGNDEVHGGEGKDHTSGGDGRALHR